MSVSAPTAVHKVPLPANSAGNELDKVTAVAVAAFTAARTPLIVVDADLISANIAFDIAEAAGAPVMLPEGEGLASELDALTQARLYMTSRREVHARADAVLLIGAGETSSRLAKDLGQRNAALLSKRRDVAVLDAVPGQDVKEKLALLSALLSQTPAPRFSDEAFRTGREVAERLKAAKFGVAIWETGSLDSLEIATLMLLIDKLNRTTRFTALPVRRGGGWATAQLCLARWGVAPPARWVRGRAVALSADELASYSADAVLSISPFANPPVARLSVATSAQHENGVTKIDLPAASNGGIVFNPAADAYTAVAAATQPDAGTYPVSDMLEAILAQVRGRA